MKNNRIENIKNCIRINGEWHCNDGMHHSIKIYVINGRFVVEFSTPEIEPAFYNPNPEMFTDVWEGNFPFDIPYEKRREWNKVFRDITELLCQNTPLHNRENLSVWTQADKRCITTLDYIKEEDKEKFIFTKLKKSEGVLYKTPIGNIIEESGNLYKYDGTYRQKLNCVDHWCPYTFTSWIIVE